MRVDAIFKGFKYVCMKSSEVLGVRHSKVLFSVLKFSVFGKIGEFPVFEDFEYPSDKLFELEGHLLELLDILLKSRSIRLNSV